ncbi:hypothetical protein HDC92_004402 [Pedobacter sp. AK017]|uniref:sulfotransferase family 2 domain-containing protein n=1 Tax=Pedobacter sp. AK017 TaxID=2723073 RepID=UPI0016159CF3|nr:sulfotransferase family 2 domain-containing protein [Pedobacter sp. AK017]MBB5440699.1 hypothetical protein [Pedobacter sp. AK017]
MDKNLKRIGAFISIPKNASKTVLDIMALGKNRDIEYTDSLVIYENHQRGSVLAKKYDLEQLFVFCFSRNPYDRCISWYNYHRLLEPYKSMLFHDWIKNGLPHHWIRQNATNYEREGISPLLQYNFIENCRVDFIGRIENFEEDLNVVIETLNAICSEQNLDRRFLYGNKRLNTSEKQKEEVWYTDETREIVYTLLKKDFEYFGYEK